MNTTTTQTDLTVANTILAQLGANRFCAMTGAKNILGDAISLHFQLPRGAKDGINAVRVRLEQDDTYTVTFYKIARGPAYSVKTVAELSMVYCDQLRAVFTAHTGLDTSL